jgi:hypothetical protein
MPPGYINEADYAGADGTQVARDQWYKPASDLLPAPLSEEAKKRVRKNQAENPEQFEKAREALRPAWERDGGATWTSIRAGGLGATFS